MNDQLTIGDVEERSGVPATTLRYYEKVGLLPQPPRRGGQRRYPSTVFVRLQVIELCKAAGFSLQDIRILLADDAPGRQVSHDLARRKLVEVDEQISTLVRAREIIEWGLQCRCPSIDTCECGIHTDSVPEALNHGGRAIRAVR